MSSIKINKQIAFLRKQKGLTQEELANALGISNQAVSKWESAQCCPDIQFLPDIAKLFEVSVDELIGYTPVSTADDIVLILRKKIESLPKGEDYDFTFKIAAALHTIFYSKEMNPDWDTDDAIEHAEKAEWGYSGCSIPDITTTMRQGAVFFSNNKELFLMNHDIRCITSILKPLSDMQNFNILATLFRLTVHSEDAYATISEINENTGMTTEQVQNRLEGELSPFILQDQTGEEMRFRIKGMYMNILPILSLLDFK